MPRKTLSRRRGRAGDDLSHPVAPDQLLKVYFSAAPVGLALLDRQLRYVAINDRLAAMNGYKPECHLGKAVREIVGAESAPLERALRRVLRTGVPILNHELSLKLPTRNEPGYWLETYFPIRDQGQKIRLVGAIVVEITHQKKLEQKLRDLSHRLLQAQDQELRRISRELHETVGQQLSGVILMLEGFKRDPRQDAAAQHIISDTVSLARDALRQIRTMAHLLFPPALEEFGLVDALRSYVRGFSETSGIEVQCLTDQRLPRLAPVIETLSFRIVQASLNNVLRYSGSKKAAVRLHRAKENLLITIRDFGRGANHAAKAGKSEARGASVQIAKIRERLGELGGVLETISMKPGRLVRATVPLR